LMESLAKPRQFSWLSWFARGLLLLVLIIISGRLIELQVIKGGYYRALAEENRIRRIPITAPRGKILARGGEVLAGNIEVKKHVEFLPNQGYVKTTPNDNTPDYQVISEWQRSYPFGDKVAHITGYLGIVNTEEVAKTDPNCIDKGPRKSDALIGRSGLENYYDCLLRGIDGEELVEVDTTGRIIRTLGRKQPIAGSDIRTTIDARLQEKVVEAVEARKEIDSTNPSDRPFPEKGAVVILTPDGQVLSFYSTPSYDPNIFINKDADKINLVLNDVSLPLYNRVIQGAYHPGSVFKIVTAAAALEEGKIDQDFIYNDPGVIEVNSFTYANWYFTQYGSTEGEIGLQKAIARSTDTFFYKLGEFVGPDKLAQWSKKFGYGTPTGIELPSETAGLVPDPAWKLETKDEKWFLGNTYHMAIGQGDVETTPLQVARSFAVIANSGKLCNPYLNQQGTPSCTGLDISPNTIEQITKGMIDACAPGGTAFPFFDFKMPIACKTGTAETFKEGITHAWFSAFAPVESPEIIITVFAEEGGEGSYVASPVAKDILDYYFSSQFQP